MRSFKVWISLVLITMAVAPSARADFVLKLSEGGSDVVVIDQSGLDANALAKQIATISTTVGAFTIQVSFAATSAPDYQFGPNQPALDLASISIQNNSAAGTFKTLSIELTSAGGGAVDRGFASPGGTPLSLLSASTGMWTGGAPITGESVTFQSFAGDGNTEFEKDAGTATTLMTFDSSNVGVASSWAGVAVGPTFTFVAPFSMTSVMTFTLDGSGGGFNPRVNIASGKTFITPEPTSLGLACVAVPVFGFWCRRFRRKEVEA